MHRHPGIGVFLTMGVHFLTQNAISQSQGFPKVKGVMVFCKASFSFQDLGLQGSLYLLEAWDLELAV